MKVQLLFALLLLSVSMVSASDCWQLTDDETPKCEYFELDIQNCTEFYYNEYLDCERERLKIVLAGDNIIQKIVENVSPDYESEKLNRLYKLSNLQIFSFLIFSFLLYWIADNYNAK